MSTGFGSAKSLQSVKPPDAITVQGLVYERRTDNIERYATGDGNAYWMYVPKGQMAAYPHFMCTLDPKNQIEVLDIHYSANTYRIMFDCPTNKYLLIDFGEDRADKTIKRQDYTRFTPKDANADERKLIDDFIKAMKLQPWTGSGKKSYTLSD